MKITLTKQEMQLLTPEINDMIDQLPERVFGYSHKKVKKYLSSLCSYEPVKGTVLKDRISISSSRKKIEIVIPEEVLDVYRCFPRSMSYSTKLYDIVDETCKSGDLVLIKAILAMNACDAMIGNPTNKKLRKITSGIADWMEDPKVYDELAEKIIQEEETEAETNGRLVSVAYPNQIFHNSRYKKLFPGGPSVIWTTEMREAEVTVPHVVRGMAVVTIGDVLIPDDIIERYAENRITRKTDLMNYLVDAFRNQMPNLQKIVKDELQSHTHPDAINFDGGYVEITEIDTSVYSDNCRYTASLFFPYTRPEGIFLHATKHTNDDLFEALKGIIPALQIPAEESPETSVEVEEDEAPRTPKLIKGETISKIDMQLIENDDHTIELIICAYVPNDSRASEYSAIFGEICNNIIHQANIDHDYCRFYDGFDPENDVRFNQDAEMDSDLLYMTVKFDGFCSPTLSDTKHWKEELLNYIKEAFSYELFDSPQSEEIVAIPHIDPTTKHWFIDTEDTGIEAVGEDGTPATDVNTDLHSQIVRLMHVAKDAADAVAASKKNSDTPDDTESLNEEASISEIDNTEPNEPATEEEESSDVSVTIKPATPMNPEDPLQFTVNIGLYHLDRHRSTKSDDIKAIQSYYVRKIAAVKKEYRDILGTDYSVGKTFLTIEDNEEPYCNATFVITCNMITDEASAADKKTITRLMKKSVKELEALMIKAYR